MRKVILVRGARQLLTLRGPSGARRGADLRNLGIIQDGAVLIVDGRIHDVGPSRRVENLALARQAQLIDASGRVVMPGFVDSTHLISGPAQIPDYEMRVANTSPLTAARGIQELSPRSLERQALNAMAEAARHGTTSLETKSGFGLTEANEIRILRVHTALGRHFIPVTSTFQCAQVSPDFRDAPDAYLEWSCSHMLPLIRRRKLAEFAAIHCRDSGFSVEQARSYLRAASRLGFGLRVHTGGGGPAAGTISMAVELGVSSLEIAGNVSPDDAALLAESETIATLLPGPAFYSRSGGYAPARMLIDAGAALALASNFNAETSPSLNMQMMIALACGNMSMTPAEAVTAATINAACALRLGSRIGTLEPGKQADLAILSVPDYREIPYHFGVNQVELAMKDGRVLVERSEVTWPAL